MLSPKDFFDLRDSVFADIFDGVEYVWEALEKLKAYASGKVSPNVRGIADGSGIIVSETTVLCEGRVVKEGFSVRGGDASKGALEVIVDGKALPGASVIYAGAVLMGENIYIGKGTVVEPGALIKEPAYIGDNSEVRQGAYLRGNVMVGNGCVVGHTTEVKSSLMLGGSKAGHFAYIGDSILGKVNLGAGTRLANLKVLDSGVVLRVEGREYDTGLRKFGAIMGDGAETGCNTVTSPGTLLSKGCLTYPNSIIRGFHPEGTIVKVRQDQQTQKKRV
ncbi:MAG: glucose-1-phosphate thymidylyltransferase [Candidatus Omnitrophica bacterium]|nr:glucose-1-phosphate thymidylyltransferase [Candidatus Omnitrophota bacterium]